MMIKNMRKFTFLEEVLFYFVTILPASENILSLGAEVAGTFK